MNGFSLNETGPLAPAIEKTGQAIDVTYMSTTKLVRLTTPPPSAIRHNPTKYTQIQELEQNWAEPLNEYTQFASIIKKLLVYRHQKHVQFEMTQEGLEAKREQLDDLEKSEREAKRLEEALGRGPANVASTSRVTGEEDEVTGVTDSGDQPETPQQSQSSYLPPHPGPNPVRRRAPGMGFLSALSYTLHGMMDVDPATARRNGISKGRETISQVTTYSSLSIIFVLF